MMMNKDFLDKLYAISEICSLLEDVAFVGGDQYSLEKQNVKTVFSIATKNRMLMMIYNEADEEQKKLVVPKIEGCYADIYGNPGIYAIIQFLWTQCKNEGMLRLREITPSQF